MLRDLTLMLILAIGMPIHAILSLRDVVKLGTQRRRRSTSVYLVINKRKLAKWIACRLLDFMFFILCLGAFAQQIATMKEQIRARAEGRPPVKKVVVVEWVDWRIQVDGRVWN